MREVPNAAATLRLVSMYAAMRGSRYATDEDNRQADEIEAMFPGTRALFRDVGKFHARALAWALTDGGCEGALVACRGFPDRSAPWHAEARRLAPRARIGYVTGHPAAARMCAVEYAAEATCWTATTLDPDALLDSPEGRSLGRPLHLQFHMLFQHLSGSTCAWLLREYARRLTAGSSIALSCWLAGDSQQGHELAAMLAATGWPVHAHSEDDLRQWIAAARLEAHGRGITDIGGFGRADLAPVGPDGRQGQRRRPDPPEGRLVEVVALKAAG